MRSLYHLLSVLVASMGINSVEFLLERLVAIAAVIFGETDFAAFFAAVAAEFVDAFVGLWIDDETHTQA
jgi:hypothetical protein